MKYLIFNILFFLPAYIFAQWSENFSEGNFRNWNGDTSSFIVNFQKQAQLNAIAAGEKWIYREFSYQQDFEWSFYFEMQFAPSATNKCRIYLSMDQANIASFNGYYLEIGENGANDNWKLYVQNSNKITLLGQGELGKLSTDPTKAKFNCSRKNDSIWQIKVDYTGGNNYSEIAEVKDSIKIIIKQAFFGIDCIFTSTRADKFIFDDIIIDAPKIDLISPTISNIQAIDDKSILVNWDENIDTNSVKNLNNFTEQISLGTPNFLKIINQQSIELRFNSSMTQNSNYTLRYKDVSDLNGNIVIPEKTFSFLATFKYYPKVNDLLINEFMSDPDPAVNLPDAEFIEIYNQSLQSIELDGMKLSDGSSISSAFKSYTLNAKEYLIICNAKDSNLFKPYGNTLGLTTLPTLNNDGDQIILYDRNNEIINSINYNLSWHTDLNKKNGGYSLELQKPNQICQTKNAWGTSSDPSGGTPGKINTNLDLSSDAGAPKLLKLIPLSDYEISLQFDEILDLNTMGSLSNYSISPNITLASADVITPENTEVILLLNNPIKKGSKYELTINKSRDCAANESGVAKFNFEIPSDASLGDLLFNEILFNPKSGGVDYLEFYNHSTKVIQTKNLYLNNSLKDSKWTKINTNELINPDDLVVFSSDIQNIIKFYPTNDPSKMIETNIPTMDDDEGFIRIATFLNGNYIVIDSVHYSQNWHNPLISNKSGVSLEKLNPTQISNESHSWTSASAFAKYGTPGLRNSQYLDLSNQLNSDLPYEIGNYIISPNGDSFRDFLVIYLNSKVIANKVNIKIFDLSGNEIKTISQDIVGSSDVITWVGDDKNGKLVFSGNYILYMSFINPNGEVMNYKERITVDSE